MLRSVLTIPSVSLTFLILALSASAPAQKTWVVDAKGGGHYKDPQAAVNAASPGDTIRIKAGSYGGVSTSKPLHFSGEPGVSMGTVSLGFLPVGSRSTLSRLSISVLYLATSGGSVHCESLQLNPIPQRVGFSCDIRSCVLTTFTNCTFGCDNGRPPLVVSRSKVTLTGCTSRGWNAGGSVPFLVASSPALSTYLSDLRMSGCQLQGGAGAPFTSSGKIYFQNASPALLMSGGSLIVDDAAGTTLAAGVPVQPTTPVPAVIAASTKVVLDPAVRLKSSNTNQHVEGTTPTLKAMPGLFAQGAKPGAQFGTARYGTPGSVSILLLSLPAGPTATPYGELWLELRSLLAVDPVVMPSTGIHPLGIPLPWQGVPPGLAVTFQGLELAKGKLDLSLPTTAVVY